MAKYFTSDWHIGEQASPRTHSFLRPHPNDKMINDWFDQCWKIIQPNDELYILGDLIITLDDLKLYENLPTCHLIVIPGDKETNNKRTNGDASFTYQEFIECINNQWWWSDPEQFTSYKLLEGPVEFVEIDGKTWRMAHKPEDLFGFSAPMPSLCGHVHGIWRTQCLPNGQPIINVGIDAWGGLVSEAHINHQYDAITKGYYDKNARVDLWQSS